MNNNMMGNNNNMMNNNMMGNNNNMMNNNMMNNNLNNMGMNYNNPQVLTRLSKEFQLCLQDNDLIQIGCNFGLENNNMYTWRVTMVGPVNTPYDGGLFILIIKFPPDYPNHGPEFVFKNKMYHLNVNQEGHICLTSINEWFVTGKVKNSFYTVKQALFDIFCLFYNQGVESAYDPKMAEKYKRDPDQFNLEAQQWTKEYASPQN